jgi:hypothetical protein
MTRRRYPLLFVCACLFAMAAPAPAQNAPSPEQVLGYALGERFTDHASVVRYMDALVASAPTMARVQRYGETPEGRARIQVVIARPDHFVRLDEKIGRNRTHGDPATPI